MDSTHKTGPQSDLRSQFDEFRQLIEAGQYEDALDIIRSIRMDDPRNIFVIALEKQLEKLHALTNDPALSDPGREEEIRQSLPNLVQRATAKMKDNDALAIANKSQHAGERKIALAHLKNTYFQIAEAHLRNREYLNALQEVKRILILEPENPLAKEYQRKIQELINKEKGASSPATTGVVNVEQEDAKRIQVKDAPEAPSSGRSNSRKAPLATLVETRPDIAREGWSLKRSLIITAAAIAALSMAIYFIYGLGTTNLTPIPPLTNNNGAETDRIESPKTKTESEKPHENSSNSQTVSGSPREPIQNAPAESSLISKGNLADNEPQPLEKPVSASQVKETRSTQAPVVPTEQPRAKNTKDVIPDDGVRSPKNEEKTPPLKRLEVVTDVPVSVSKPLVRPTFTERKPEIVRLTKPGFPEAARSAAMEGEVLVKVLIDTEGKPLKAKIVTSTNDIFNDAVIDAVMNSQYSPGVMPSGPVATWLTIPFVFKRNASH